MSAPIFDFRGNKVVNEDGTFSDVAQNYFDALSKYIYTNLGGEGIVMPSQNTVNIGVIANNQNTQSAYTCQFGTFVYNSDINDPQVSINVAGVPTFVSLLTPGGVTISGVANQIVVTGPSPNFTIGLANTIITNSGTVLDDGSGNMSIHGTLTLSANPTLPLQAATKQYVDAAISGDVTSITGTANQITASSATGAVTLSFPSILYSANNILDNGSGLATFLNIIDSGLTASQAVVTNGSKQLISLAYTSANTASTLVLRDSSGNFSAGTITATLTGHASLDLLASNDLSDVGSASVSATNLGLGTGNTPTFTNLILSGLTASQAVVTNGSKQLISLTYTSSNTASTLVERDGSGNFSAGTITATITGHSSLDLSISNNLSDVANASTARTNLGLAIGTNVEAWSAVLDTVSAGTYIGSNSITTLGTVTTGVWNGSLVPLTYGGTNANLTAAANSIVYSSSTAMSLLAPSNSSVLASSSTGAPTWLGALTNGQIIIGSTGAIPVAATLTQGSGVTITNAAGAITISATGSGGTVTSVTGTAPIASTGGTTPVISLNGTSTAQQLLMSLTATTTQYSTTTYPLTNAVNTILWASSANVMAALATANNAVLCTGATGIPAMTTTGTFSATMITSNLTGTVTGHSSLDLPLTGGTLTGTLTLTPGSGNAITATTGLTSLAGGLTVSGAATNINTAGSFNVNIGNGVYTGTINIGNGAGLAGSSTNMNGAVTFGNGSSSSALFENGLILSAGETISVLSPGGALNVGDTTYTTTNNLQSTTNGTINIQTNSEGGVLNLGFLTTVAAQGQGGLIALNGSFALNSSTYSTGTITGSGSTITGSGTTWTSAMNQGVILVTSGTNIGKQVGITYVSATSLTADNSFTVAAGSSYIIYYLASQISPRTVAFCTSSNQGAFYVGTNTFTGPITLGNSSNSGTISLLTTGTIAIGASSASIISADGYITFPTNPGSVPTTGTQIYNASGVGFTIDSNEVQLRASAGVGSFTQGLLLSGTLLSLPLPTTVTGLLTGNGGLTISGAVNVNTSGSSAINIGTGSYTGTITIGNTSLSTSVALNSGDDFALIITGAQPAAFYPLIGNNSTASSDTFLLLQVAGSDKVAYGWQTGMGIVLYDQVNNNNWLSQGTGASGYVASVNNILDNGSGAMTIASTAINTRISNGALIFSGSSLSIGRSNSPTSGNAAELNFGQAYAQRMVCLYDGGTLGNDDQNQFFGFGIAPNTLHYAVNGTGASHKFYAGTSSSASTLLFTIAGTGAISSINNTLDNGSGVVEVTGPFWSENFIYQVIYAASYGSTTSIAAHDMNKGVITVASGTAAITLTWPTGAQLQTEFGTIPYNNQAKRFMIVNQSSNTVTIAAVPSGITDLLSKRTIAANTVGNFVVSNTGSSTFIIWGGN